MALPGGSPRGGTSTSTSTGGISPHAVLAEVSKYQGTPYVWGGSQPGGFDCSGLIYYGLTQLGLRNVPRTSEGQWAWVKKIQPGQVQPGDLVFFTGDLSSGDASPGHVGVVDSTGTTWSMIDAPYSGVDVRKDSFSVPGSGTLHVVGFGRPPGVAGGGGAGSQQQSGGGLFSLVVPQSVTEVFTNAETVVSAAGWWFNPENWMRVLAGIFGGLLLIAGLVAFTKAAA